MNARRGMARSHPLVLSLIALGAGLALWIAFARLVVPPLIERAYRGESLPIFNRMIRGQASVPVEHYLHVWDLTVPRITVAALAFGLIGVILFSVTSSPAFFRRFVGTATPGALGALRILTCSVVLFITTIEDLPSIALLPPETRAPQGLMRWAYTLPIGFDRLVASEAGLRVFQTLTEVILFLGILGWHSRVVIPLGAGCHFLLGGILRDYSYDWHQGWVPLYLMVILSFTPCADGWSVDRLRTVRRGRALPDADRAVAIYGWARYMCWVAIALPYVESGLAKLRYRGLSWWSGSNMRNILYTETLRPREFDWQVSLHLASAPDFVFSLLGLASVVLEVAFGLVLFSRRARRVLPVAMVAMHGGIWILQRILFVDLILLQLAFVDWTRMGKRIRERLAAGRRIAPSSELDRGEGTIAADPTTGRLGFPATLTAWVLASVLCWYYVVEHYPLTSWHLFAWPYPPGRVTYYRVVARFDSGERAPLRLEDTIGAMRFDARYDPFLAMCFGKPHPRHASPGAEDDRRVCRTFLTVGAKAYNRKARLGARVTQLEIQVWEWDFGSNPFDPGYGHQVDRFVLDVPADHDR